MLSNIPSELKGLLDQYGTENGTSEDDYTNYIMLQILATYDDDVTGSVQAAAEEMEEMTNYVDNFNSAWFEDEPANITDQS